MGCIGVWLLWLSCIEEDKDMQGHCCHSCHLRCVMARVGCCCCHQDEGDRGRKMEGDSKGTLLVVA